MPQEFSSKIQSEAQVSTWDGTWLRSSLMVYVGGHSVIPFALLTKEWYLEMR